MDGSLVLISFLAVCGQTLDVSAQAPTVDSIERAVRQLSDSEFQTRQQATDYLWTAGEAAVPALERAANGDDAEAQLRAREILERFRYGIFVDTPAEQVEWIRRFRHGSENEQRRAFQALVGESQIVTLLALLEATESPLRSDLQEMLLKRLEEEGSLDRLLELATRWRQAADSETHRRMLEEKLRGQVPRLLIRGHVEQAEGILRQAATGDQGLRDWAVYCLLTHALDTEMALLSVRPLDELDPLQKRQLIYFWRSRGALGEARQVAQSLNDPSREVLRGLLFEMQDWSALAELQRSLLLGDPLGQGRNVEALGYAAAFYRLAGKEQDFQRTLQAIQSLAERRTALEWNSAEALIINGQIEAGIEILRPRMPSWAFQMLAIQDRYEAAFALAGFDDPDEDHTRWFEMVAAEVSGNSQLANRKYELAVQMIPVLYSLGEADAALGYADILAKAVEHDRSGTRLHELCKVEYRMGLRERAVRHAAQVLEKGRHPDPLPTLFPGQTETARAWWDYFQEARQEGPEALREIGRLLTATAAGAISSEQLQRRLKEASQFADRSEAGVQRGLRMALAETALLHGLEQQAREYFELAASSSSSAAARLGDLSAQAKDWPAAARWYERAWQSDPTDFLSLYLQGHALRQAGQAADGERLTDLAKLLPLADVVARRRLALGMKQRGLLDEAVEQWKLVLSSGGFLVSLSGQFGDTSMVDAAQNVGNALEGDPLARADYWQMMHLSCLEARLWIPTFRGYFRVPHLMHQTRAVAHLQQRRLPEALQEIRAGERYLPANTEFAEQLVPKLEAAGCTEEAEALFERYYEAIERICQAFPNSAQHHNNLAWMSARCNRRLDDALQHVRRALELVPDSAAYLDTLGEVHFRRGEITEAVQCAERCLEMEPNNAFYRRQFSRFQEQLRDAP